VTQSVHNEESKMANRTSSEYASGHIRCESPHVVKGTSNGLSAVIERLKNGSKLL
jgi:hypothetical protein